MTQQAVQAWTATVPTAAGWYWVRWADERDWCEVVEVIAGPYHTLWVNGQSVAEFAAGREWWGPIPMPPLEDVG